MPVRDENLFFFVSHGGTDKSSPELAAVLERLHEAEIPMGIDRPDLIDGLTTLRTEDFAWSFDSQLIDWSGLVIRALAEGACGIIVMASSNTKKDSHVWQELLAAQAVQASGKPNFGFYLLALEPGAHVYAPNRYRNANFFDARRELDGQIKAMRAQLEAERIQRAARPIGQRLAAAAMRRTILKTRSVRLVGGGEIALDSVFTPLRGDLLSAAERTAAQSDFLDPLEVRGAGAHEDRLTRIEAIANRILQNPIMPGMPRGQAAASDPWAVAGAPTNLSDIVDRTGRVVILGEPAAGKSTLLQWLALRFAESWSALDDAGGSNLEVEVLGLHVDPNLRSIQESTEEPRHVSLGLARLPILTSIPKLCDTLRTKGVGDLVGFLALQLAQLVNDTEFPGAEKIAHEVILTELRRGRLVVLLDGLDEVPEEDRNTALPLIEDFAETWTSATPDVDRDPSRNNRLVVTSRIVGYHALPLSAEWPHVVVDRMTAAVVLELSLIHI